MYVFEPGSASSPPATALPSFHPLSLPFISRRSSSTSRGPIPEPPAAADAKIAPMAGSSQRQCRRGVSAGGRDEDVELDAAMALADMAGAVAGAPPQPQAERSGAHGESEEEEASTRLSLELGRVGIQGAAAASSPCSSSSSAGGCPTHQQALPAVAAPGAGYGARPRHSTLTEAEKEAKRLRRVLANRESARQTILRRQAIRDELARKVADLSSQNESMKKEKETVMQEYLTLQETNKQLKEQVVAKTADRSPSPVPIAMPMGTAEAPAQRAEASQQAAAPPPPPQPGFLYATAGPSSAPVPVPYVWGTWPPGYEPPAAGAPPPPLCLPPMGAWYYPAPPSYAAQQSFAGAGGSPVGSGGGGTAGEEEDDTDDGADPCSLTLGLEVGGNGGGGGRADKAATAAEARKRRKELTRMKHARPGGDE